MARTESAWVEKDGYVETNEPDGLDVLINGANKYVNFDSLVGSNGYGFRDNNGVMEYKDEDGNWVGFSSYLPTSTASSTYVPYTGATKDVNLGSNSLSLGKRIILENTTSSDTGVIYKGTTPFIHNFSHPTGDTAIPAGYNTFVGLNAGNFTMGSTATSVIHASCNTAVGTSALSSNTTGFSNSALGYAALLFNTTGMCNSALGSTALFSNTIGGYNSAFGYASLTSNTTGCYNTATGMYSLRSNTTGTHNTASGYNSGRYIADGTTPNATSNRSLYLGSLTKPLADGDTNEIVIGYNAIGAGSNTATLGNTAITKTILRGSVGIGTTTPSQKLDIIGNINIDGTSAYLYAGHNAIKLATKGDTTTYTSTIIGRGAGDGLTNGTTARQTAVGYSAGYGNSGANQTTLGYTAGYQNTGASQTAVGYAAGFGNTGANQTAVGYSAGYGNSGIYQTALGYYAGFGNTGIYQTALGYDAGRGNTGAIQTALGYCAGHSNTGANVIGIGYEATRGNQAHNVVAIGYQAGKDNTLANQFIVKQANLNATPLIQGDFVSGNVGVGITSPTAKLDIGSDILRLRTAKTPASSSSSANTGDIFWDSDYLYIAVGTNSIKRVPLQSF